MNIPSFYPTRCLCLALFCTLSMYFPFVSLAQDQATPNGPELPCILAASGTLGYGDFAQQRPNCTNIMQMPRVGASVSKVDRRSWELNVQNSLDKGIRISMNVESYDGTKKRLGSTPANLTLKSGQSHKRKISVREDTTAVAVVVNNYSLE